MTSPQSHLSHPKYRPDIDGLRAIAVLSVVAFHAFPNHVKGGFIGVDVFFVISGYLISTIIFENLDKGTFSFAEFYTRRIKRIFPALLLVLTACYAVGWLVLLADEYKQLGKHIAAGAGFVSNIILWSEAGYFDNSAETKPLLHLWSLGIEEQFYMVWPLLLWLAWKRKFNLLTITILIAFVSFYLNIKGIKKDSVATFYSPQTRFWELLCGSLLAWFTLYKNSSFNALMAKLDGWVASAIYRYPHEADGKTLANLFAFAGILLLSYGFWRLNKELDFPGKWAVLPVIAAILIICAGPKAWPNRVILSNRLAVWFGLISFPLYLWHWPLLSFPRIFEGETPSASIRIACVLVSVVLAWLTYKLVETPVRLGKVNGAMVASLFVLMGIAGVAGYGIYDKNGYPFRPTDQKLSTYVNSIKFTDRASECFEIPYAHNRSDNWFCELGSRSKNAPVKYFAYGDSHALSLIPALEKFAADKNVKIHFTGTSGCPSLLGIQSMRGEAMIEKFNCKELNERVFNHVKNSGIKNVILINRWVYYTGSVLRPSEMNYIARNAESTVNKDTSAKDWVWAVENTVSRYKSIGVNVIFVEDNPQQLYEPKDILKKGRGEENRYLEFSVKVDAHLNNQKFVNEVIRSQGAKVINFDKVLCDDKICPLVRNSRFLYSDDDHLSIEGALGVYPVLSKELVN